MSMALRVWPQEALTATQAQNRLRSSFLDAIQSYMTPNNEHVWTPKTIIDIGLSMQKCYLK